ncbi:MAG: hypothetical protein ACFE8J_04465 [Candidatus Heimdallarchaeota archaeon]
MLAVGVNDKQPAARQSLLKIAKILKLNNPTNMLTEKAWNISSIIQATFTNINSVKSVIKSLKEENLGISIVISGLLYEIEKLVNGLDLKMHTVHLSLGTFGKIKLLPSEKILEITTMCGHHCISPQSVEHYLTMVKSKKISIEKAAKNLAKFCICGIFNTSRAKNLLKSIVEEDEN